MAQKRIQYIKTANGPEKQLIASAADIVELEKIEGLDATNVQEAIEELSDIATKGGVTGIKGENETDYRQGQVNITKDNIGLGNVTNDAQVKRTEMGVANGVATLDDTGKVPASQLPSYVDDTVEGYYDSTDNKFYSDPTKTTEILGASSKIYVDLTDNKTYRWSGSTFVEISASLALGETPSTAYAGDKGRANADNIEKLIKWVEKIDISGEELLGETVQKSLVAEEAGAFNAPLSVNLEGDATAEFSIQGPENQSDGVTATITLANSGVSAGTYTAVAVDAKGRVTAGNQIVEWGASGQTAPSANLAVGGLFFALVE